MDSTKKPDAAKPPHVDAPAETATTPAETATTPTHVDAPTAAELLVSALLNGLESAKAIMLVQNAGDEDDPKTQVASELLKTAALLTVAATRLSDADMSDNIDRTDVDTACARVVRAAQKVRTTIGDVGKKKPAPAEDA